MKPDGTFTMEIPSSLCSTELEPLESGGSSGIPLYVHLLVPYTEFKFDDDDDDDDECI